MRERKDRKSRSGQGDKSRSARPEKRQSDKAPGDKGASRSRTGEAQRAKGGFDKNRSRKFTKGDGGAPIYLYGLHTVRAAFENDNRKIIRLLSSKNAWERLQIGDADQLPFPVEMTEPRNLDKMLGRDAIHQGIVAQVLPLKAKPLNELSDTKLVVVLDEVTDPHNVGAIMRSAVALGAGALITTTRNSPQESGVLAKSASGALEMIDHIQVKNLGQAIEELHFQGFQTIGLDSEGPQGLEDTFSGNQIALVLGAEGKGLRQKTRTIVSDLARLDMPGAIKSLNVSNAATLSLYAAHRFLQSAP